MVSCHLNFSTFKLPGKRMVLIRKKKKERKKRMKEREKKAIKLGFEKLYGKNTMKKKVLYLPFSIQTK